MPKSFGKRRKAEAKPRAVNQSPPIDLDIRPARRPIDVNFAGCFYVLKNGFGSIAGSIIICVIAHNPATIPFKRAGCGLAVA